MPAGARLLSVGAQRNEPYIWALVDTDTPPQTRQFASIGTGRDANMARFGKYLGVYRLDAGAVVYHVFELTGNATSG